MSVAAPSPLHCWLLIAAMLAVPLVLGTIVSFVAPLTYPF